MTRWGIALAAYALLAATILALIAIARLIALTIGVQT